MGVILDSGMCQLVAVSQYRNKRIIAYEMVTGPPLPFSLASSGAVVSDGKPLYGFHRFESDTGEVRFDSDLELNGALVYVKGDMTLTKPLKGTAKCRHRRPIGIKILLSVRSVPEEFRVA